MKVLHVTHGYLPENTGGVETYLRMVVAAQRLAGDTPLVLAGSTDLRPECRVESSEYEGTPVHRLLRDDWFNDHYANSHHGGAARLTAEFLDEHRPDIVHLHQWLRLSSDLVHQARARSIPTIITLHDVYTSCPRAFRVDRAGQPCIRRLSATNCASCVPRFGHEPEDEVTLGIELFHDQYVTELAAAHRVLVAAEATADLLQRVTATPRERYTVHRLPYEPRFQNLPPAPPRADDAPFRFGYWGSLSPHKGPHVLLEAFRKMLAQTDRPTELHLLGPLATNEERQRLESLATGLPVTFHGPFDAPELAAAGLNAAVFPVLCFEGFGLGLAEAFELGLPAIVSEIGALADRIGDAGLRVPPGDIDALANAMHRFVTEEEFLAGCRDAIPDLPITPQAHIAELREFYAEARATNAPTASSPIATERRLQLLIKQRESVHAALRDARGRQDPQ